MRNWFYGGCKGLARNLSKSRIRSQAVDQMIHCLAFFMKMIGTKSYCILCCW